jgi:hypothetical protein
MQKGLVFVALASVLTWVQFAHGDERTKERCVSANEAAQDQRRSGKLHAAKASLAICMASGCPDVVRQDCATRFAELEDVIPTLVFAIEDAAGRDVHDVRISMDGKGVVDVADGAPLVVDPGEHDFTFEAEGLRTTKRRLVVREGEKSRRIQIVMPVKAVLGSEQPTSQADEAIRGDLLGGLGTQRSLALGVGGSGAALWVVGTVFGILSKVTYDHASNSECVGGPKSCTSEGVREGQAAHDQAAVATAAFVSGAVLLGGAAGLFFTAKVRTAEVSWVPRVGPQSAGMTVTGTW